MPVLLKTNGRYMVTLEGNSPLAAANSNALRQVGREGRKGQGETWRKNPGPRRAARSG